MPDPRLAKLRQITNGGGGGTTTDPRLARLRGITASPTSGPTPTPGDVGDIELPENPTQRPIPAPQVGSSGEGALAKLSRLNDAARRAAGPLGRMSEPGDFLHGIFTGVGQTVGSVGEMAEAVGADRAGAPFKSVGQQIRDANEGRVTSLSGIHSIQDAIDYGQYTVGQGLASTAAPIVGAVLGTAVAPGIGTFAGAAGPSYVQSVGELREGLRDAGVTDRGDLDKYALLGAIPVAALDIITPGKVASQAAEKAATRGLGSVLKRVARNAGEDALGEGVTEGLQEGTQIVVEQMATPTPVDMANPADLLPLFARAGEAAVGGALTGGILGGGSGAVGSLRGAPAPTPTPVPVTSASPVDPSVQAEPVQPEIVMPEPPAPPPSPEEVAAQEKAEEAARKQQEKAEADAARAAQREAERAAKEAARAEQEAARLEQKREAEAMRRQTALDIEAARQAERERAEQTAQVEQSAQQVEPQVEPEIEPEIEPQVEQVAPPEPTEAAATTEPVPSDGAGTVAAPELQPERVGSVPLADLDVEPDRFQFKLNTDERGVTRSMDSVRKWDPKKAGVIQVWRDPEDGRLKVVNGHHRVALARRLGVDDMNVMLIDAEDSAEARAIGATTNIAEGRGTAVDAAKLLRDTGITREQLQAEGVPMTESVARDGLALAALPQALFDDVAAGRMPVQRAALIGGSGLSEAQQLGLAEMLEKREKGGRRRLTNAEVGELVRFVRGAGETNVEQDSLFGTESLAQSLAVEKAEVSAYVRDRLSKDRRLFGFLTRAGRAERIEGAGAGQIDAGRASEVADDAARAEEVYNRLSTMSGPISDMLTSAARELAQRGSRADIQSRLWRDIKPALTAEFEAITGGRSAGAQAGARDAGGGAADPERGTASVAESAPGYSDYGSYDLFGERVGGEQEVQGSLLPDDERGLAAAEQRAAALISSLEGKVARGAATDAEKRAYSDARALLQRREKLRGSDVARARGENASPTRTLPGQESLFERGRRGRSASRNAVTTSAQLRLEFGSVEAAGKVTAEMNRRAPDLLQISLPGVSSSAERIARVRAGREAAFAWVPATGHKLSGPLGGETLFQLLRAYRHPSAEYLHVLVVTPDGTVAHHRMTSSGVIDQQLVSMGDVVEAAGIAARIGGQVLLAHNHPSGNPTPSRADHAVTRTAEQVIRSVGASFGGHLVMDHDVATMINADGHETKVSAPRDRGPMEWTRPDLPRITHPADPLFILAGLPVDESRLDILLLDTQNVVVAFEVRPAASLETVAEWLPGLLRDAGARSAVLGATGASYSKAVAAVNGTHGGGIEGLGVLDVVDPDSIVSAADTNALRGQSGAVPTHVPIFEGRQDDTSATGRQAEGSTDATDAAGATGATGADAIGAEPDVLSAADGDEAGGGRAGAGPAGQRALDRRSGRGLDTSAGDPLSPDSPGTLRLSFGLDALLDLMRGKDQTVRPTVTSAISEVEKRWAESRGMPTEGTMQQVRAAVASVWHAFRRHFEYLDPSSSGAMALTVDTLRVLESAPQWAKVAAVDMIAQVTKGLDSAQVDLVTRVLALRDITRDIEEGKYGEVDPDTGELARSLPFGYPDPDAVASDLDLFEQAASKDKKVSAALDARRDFASELTRQLVELELLPADVLKDDRYYHRQVMEYLRAEAESERRGVGVSSRDVRNKRKGFQRSRVGGGDFNTAYTEAEFEWVAQALSQIATKQALERLQATNDIRPALERQAKARNEAATEVELLARGELSSGEDPFQPFKAKIGMSLSRLGKLAEKGQLPAGPFAQLVAEWGSHMQAARGMKVANRTSFNHPRLFDYLGWLAEQPEGTGGLIPALTVFKAIRDREQLMKDTLGDKYLVWQDLVPDTHATWQPEQGNYFHGAFTVEESVLERALAEGRTLTQDEMDRALVVAQRKPEWVIPAELAATLDEFRPPRRDVVEGLWSTLQAGWKQWVLLNPVRALRYNLNNMSGDLDIALAYSPRILARMPQAVKDLRAFAAGRASPALRAELLEATKLAVLGSGISIAEIPDIHAVGPFRGIAGAAGVRRQNALRRIVDGYWSKVRGATDVRENILRLAAYRHFQAEIAAGRKVYGASTPKQVDAITDPNRRAAKLSRELVGDYGNVSHAGTWIRSRLIPFYSWLEINAPRYVRLLRNIGAEGRGRGRAAGVAGMLTMSVAKDAAWLAVRMNMMFLLTALWNRLMFGDEEDELRAEGRGAHLILGRHEDGSIRTIRVEGAFADALDWFALGDWPSDVADLLTGRTTASALAAEAVKAPVERVIQGWEPFSKTVFETVSGRKTYPSIFEKGTSFGFDTRPIRDRAEHVAGAFSLSSVYRKVMGRPSRPGGIARSLLSAVSYETDPGEAAYYSIRDKASEYLRAQGRAAPSITPTDRQNALYYFKLATKWGDERAARRWLERYKELGGTASSARQSVSASSPLAFVPKVHRRPFVETLTPAERDMLRAAEEWYRRTLAAPARRSINARKRQGQQRPERAPYRSAPSLTGADRASPI